MAKLLRHSLGRVLPPAQIRAVETGIDVIGDIAIVKLGYEGKEAGSEVGRAIMEAMRNVKAVFDQEGGLEGDFRLRRLRHLAGERRTLTLHRENMLRFMVDVEKCYFSPRLSTERARIAGLVEDDELVLNMFAGVGPYSITIAKKTKATVYSNELNEAAYKLHLENNRLNKVEQRVRTLNQDAKELPRTLDLRFDRILMPHPSQSDRFLKTARSLLKSEGWIHYYRHVSGANFHDARDSLETELHGLLGAKATHATRRVREIGPHYLELVADIRIEG